MKIDVGPSWLAGDSALDDRLLPLLRQVATTGSLNRGVAALRMSYRHAWGMLLAAERVIGASLITRERGRGARLTAFAESLLAADASASAVIRRELRTVLQSLNQEAVRSRSPVSPRSLVIHASHDLALADLRELLAGNGHGTIDLHFRGSLDSLASLSRQECDIAGFHLPQPPLDDAALAPYRPWLTSRELRLIGFVRRTQGLIVAPGNPKSLRSVSDIASQKARFVNRQPESGTRLCFDRLLASENLRPSQISGYEVEEFTHAAVAATIASGMADTGFGIEAAARRHGLDFVPIIVERYLLASRARVLNSAAARQILSTLKGSAFARRVAALPGYEPDRMGEIFTVREALRAG